MKYKYTLQKYVPGIQQKHICPNCGKKTFVRYVDEKGHYVGDDIGRCDREIKCGYHKKPGGDVVTDNGNKFDVIKEKDTLYLDVTMLEKAKNRNVKENGLFIYLSSKFGEEKVLSVFDKYNVCVGKNKNEIIFWQIDELFNIRTAKIIEYGIDGKRVKSADGVSSIRWAHNYVNYDKEQYTMRQCFFGMHLLNSKRYKSINVVESEKTAIVCDMFFNDDDVLWLACGGRNNINDAKLMYLKSFCDEVFLYPDVDSFSYWTSKFNHLSTIDIKVINWLRDCIDASKINDSDDIADAIFTDNILKIEMSKKDENVLSNGETIEKFNNSNNCEIKNEYKYELFYDNKRYVFSCDEQINISMAKLIKDKEGKYFIAVGFTAVNDDEYTCDVLYELIGIE